MAPTSGYDKYGDPTFTYNEYDEYGQGASTTYDEYGQSVIEETQFVDGNYNRTGDYDETQDDESQYQAQPNASGTYHDEEELSDTQDESQFCPPANENVSLSHKGNAARLQPTDEEAVVLANARNGQCLIQEPCLQRVISPTGRNYTPALGRIQVQRVLGLSDFDWQNIRGLSRTLVRLHHLDSKDANGKTIRWPEKDPRNKQAAQKKLELQFSILARCQGSWASDYFLRTHTNNKIDVSTRPPESGSRNRSQSSSNNPQSSQQTTPRSHSTNSQASGGSRTTQHPTGSEVPRAAASTVALAAPSGSGLAAQALAPAGTSMQMLTTPTIAALNVPVQVHPSSISQSVSPSPVSHESDSNEQQATVPAPAAKRAKTTKTSRGRPKGSKAPRAKPQTKAELAQAYQDLLRQHNLMQASITSQPQAMIESTSPSGTSSGTRTVSPEASRQLPTPEPTPTSNRGKNLGTPRARNSIIDPSLADGVTRSGRATFKTPAKRVADQARAQAIQSSAEQARRASAKQTQAARRNSLEESSAPELQIHPQLQAQGLQPAAVGAQLLDTVPATAAHTHSSATAMYVANNDSSSAEDEEL